MDDSFQFIIESPQHTSGQKKRPRLVTSCDNCRLKKIKCLQPSPETKCEACKTAKIPCRFRDRERYFAERSRAIAGPNATSSYNDEQRSENPSMDAFSASGVAMPEIDPNGRYQAYNSSSRRSVDSDRASPPSMPTRGYNSFSSAAPTQMNPRSNSRQVHLFDPDRPERPHPSLTPHFIQTFFDRMGNDYPWISYDEITAEYWDQTLSPQLANCIAALASRYSTLPELTVRGLHNVSDAYSEAAKSILSSMAHVPSFNTLHAFMLLSWSEYRNNRIPSFRSYCAMAMRMAMDLGLSDQNISPPNASEKERNRRRTTWQGILQLHVTSSSFRQ
ncbi:hypothetical protein C8J56DRAFT_927363 [Mycena floridula]|nr:hypothetical protein C8J56DRAFT_927363 [Mycena floridula]